MGWVRFGLSNSNIFPSFAVTWGSSRVHSEKLKILIQLSEVVGRKNSLKRTRNFVNKKDSDTLVTTENFA